MANPSEISKMEYQVFLSFRGPDTRQGFADVFYKELKGSGIKVFRDDDELPIGKDIELILEAIKNSKVCIPIFSKSFASSAWCLREVAKMVELNKEIVPVFYHVTPDDVKLKTPLYVEQMKIYEGEHVEEWKKALTVVGRIKGRELKETKYTDFSEKFRKEILPHLRVSEKFTITRLVEMTVEVEHALKLLEIGSDDVRSLGMYGMGGIGKTTLAKRVFNQISNSFDSWSFLSNIREERSSNPKGLEFLRKKILQDLDPKATDCNVNISNNWNDKMESCVKTKRVLIVLDDISERSHFEELVGNSISFGLGSRIIITTRNERALMMNSVEASSSSEARKNVLNCITKMEVKGMNPEQGMQLFSKHAFGRDCPPENYTSLSKEFVLISGGLPLSLQVIGSLLRNRSVEAWKEKVRTLKTIPPKDVQKILMISYDDLGDNTKEIFLDIACFFIDENTSNPIYMWKARKNYSPICSLEILESLSLIKITDGKCWMHDQVRDLRHGKFWMHDQVRDLGREIVRIKGNNNPTPMEGSRIKTYEDALYVQERNKGKEVVGLHLWGSDYTLIRFDKFEYLRFLCVGGTFDHTIFLKLSKNLEWLSITLKEPQLRLKKPKLSSTSRSMFSTISQNSSNPMDLVILDLSRSEITDSWDGWILIQEMRRLKVLNLGACEKLTRTLKFSKLEALEELNLSCCTELVEIDSSIGKLRKLKYLNLDSCCKVKELPEEIGNLEDLEQFLMSSLLLGIVISKLPDSIKKLINLTKLDLRGSKNLEKLPESIGDLRMLVQLNISGAKRLKELPITVGLLDKLENLNLSLCVCLNKLPDSIGDLISLVSLNVSGCYMIKELPNSITRLKKLQRLSLSHCRNFVELPSDLGNCESLIDLNLSNTLVDILPKSIGDLTGLQVLSVSCTKVCVLPETIAQLSQLQKLEMEGCARIERIPELPTSLTYLSFNVWSLTQTRDLSKLSKLRELHIDDAIFVEWLQAGTPFMYDTMGKLSSVEVLEISFESYSHFPADFNAYPRLKSLSLNCPNWLCIPPFPSSLQSLYLSDIGRQATDLSCFPDLNILSRLESNELIAGSSMEEGSYNLGVDRLESLITLRIYKYPTISKFPSLSRLKHLEKLTFSDLDQLVEIPGLGAVVSLKSLSIRRCDSLVRLENLRNLTSLRKVSIADCKSFGGIGLEELSATPVQIRRCKCNDREYTMKI